MTAVELALNSISDLKSYEYLVYRNKNDITIYVADAAEATDFLEHFVYRPITDVDREKHLKQFGEYMPMMRFIIETEESRDFRLQRWCFRGRIDGWIFLAMGKLDDLLEKYIPHLGKESFFELI